MDGNYFNNSLQPYDWQGVSKNVMDQAWLDAVKTDNKLFVDRQKADLALKKEMLKSNLAEERAINRELSVKAMITTSDGALCMECVTPRGKITISQPVCNARQMRAVRYVSANRGKRNQRGSVLKIRWDGDCEGVSIAVDRKDLTSELIRRLRKKGVKLKIPRRLYRELADYFVGMLIEHSETVAIPERVGWNQLMDGAWIFEIDPKQTLRGMIENESIW